MFFTEVDDRKLRNPRNYYDMLQRDDCDQWLHAYYQEIYSLEDVGQLQVVDYVDAGNEQILPLLELISTKYDNETKSFKRKVRMVVQGNKERAQIDETYAPVAATHIIKLVLCLLGLFGFHRRQMDFKTAFLNGRRDKPFYLELPLGHPKRQEGKVWRCLCSVYGLRDAPRRWYLKLVAALKELKLEPCALEPCLFYNTTTRLTVVLYVDDIIYLAPNAHELKKLEEHIKKRFKIKVTEKIEKFVGYEIEMQHNYIKLHAEGYIQACLKKFQLEEAKPEKNPGVKGTPLFSENSPNLRSKDKFLSMLGSLNYLGLLCRPDIMYCANFLSRASSKPQKCI